MAYTANMAALLSLDPPMSLGLSGCRNGEMPLGSGKIELV